MRDTSTTKHKPLNHWLALDLFARKIQLRIERLYAERGHAEDPTFEDWLNAAKEALAALNAG